MLTFNTFQNANEQRQKLSYSKLNPDMFYWTTALAGEVGELCNLVKKQKRDNIDLAPKIAKEIADIQTYLSLIATHFGLDLGQITIQKFNEVSARIEAPIALTKDGQISYPES